jgi:hypothetical protein
MVFLETRFLSLFLFIILFVGGRVGVGVFHGFPTKLSNNSESLELIVTKLP